MYSMHKYEEVEGLHIVVTFTKYNLYTDPSGDFSWSHLPVYCNVAIYTMILVLHNIE